MCGVAIEMPVSCEFAVTTAQQQVVEGMLGAIKQHWKPMKNTSTAGFRESFLLRDGILSAKEEHWQLNVEQKTFDMLLDQLPWSYSIVKLPWMDKSIHVQWR